jgi:hypothetical protein
MDLPAGFLKKTYLLRTGHRRQLPIGVFLLKTAQNGYLFVSLRVTQTDAKEKTVKLGFRQGKCSFKFYRVLRSHHKKGMWQGVGASVDGHLPFLHAFEKT